MEVNKKQSIDDLINIKKILSDKNEESIADKLVGLLKGNTEKRKKIISSAIKGEYPLESSAFSKVIEELVELQNKQTSQNIISKLTDIKSQENFSDFITFSEEKKEYYVIGDLHADLKSFLKILEAVGFKDNFDNINLIFLGDYIDRGKDKLELINRIILLKYLLPDNIHLLRGNHELYIMDENENYISPMANADMTYLFDFLTLLATNEKYKDYGVSKELIKLYADFFDSMPTVALFNFNNIKICAMHGGLPRVDLNSEDYYGSENYESFNKLLGSDTKDSVGIRQKINMLWSDPYDGHDEGFTDSSEVRYSFSKNQFIAFCKKYDIDMVLRAHEQQDNGYKSYFNDRLISVFSSGGKNKDDDNIVNENSYYGNVSPNILQITDKMVKSININLTKENLKLAEAMYKYGDIKLSIQLHDEEYKPYIPKKSNQDIFKDIKRSDGVITIVDMNNEKNKRVVRLQDSKIILTHTVLQQFSGINKNLKFSINQKDKTITNLCDLHLKIGTNGAIIKKDKTIEVENNFIVSMDNAFSLKIII
ncbi:MAG: metallophosphoesterase family protein [Campylobacterota bacterium]|nr:metallophosphoesterase family protein [Campylobacterota bacterium]